MRFTPALALLLATVPLAAQETQVAEPGIASPPADLDQFGWLAGQWRGVGIAGHEAFESWLPASGNTMVGTFVQEDEAGNIMFTEHMQLMEEGGSVVLCLKHFNPDLTGWEEKDAMVSFPLHSVEPCAIRFSGLTYRCDGDGGLLVTVRMRETDGSTGELVFRFAKAG